jgi:hypothetical protein
MSSYTIPVKQTTYGNITLTAGGHGGGGTGGIIYNTTGAWSNSSPGQIHVKGDAVFEGNITWQDRDMREWFESVESRLAILQPNVKLEAEWEELADLRKQYVELEKKLLEKQQVFDILKKPVD